MRIWGLIAVAALGIVGCRTHTVPDCFAPCVAEDQLFFARCVAEGSDDPCEPGNRKCCALAAECLGELDDQTVVSSAPMCTNVPASNCFPPCTTASATSYDACFSSGTATCRAGDESCCALAQDCLGTLGDVSVSADGCCGSDDDCPRGLTCDPMTYTCVGAAAGCGDGVMSSTEQCDDGNTITESCTYGQMSCTVCDASCHSVAGATRFCGDHTVDLTDGETCDPPDGMSCDAQCHGSSAMPSCTNLIQDGMETDVDCGGPTCMPCLQGASCVSPTDCRALHAADCGGVADCSTDHFCTEVTRCDDGNLCTDDACGLTGGACSPTTIDRDSDGDPPRSNGCGGDCNDRNPNISSLTAEVCADHVDNDCDAMIDEGCP